MSIVCDKKSSESIVHNTGDKSRLGFSPLPGPRGDLEVIPVDSRVPAYYLSVCLSVCLSVSQRHDRYSGQQHSNWRAKRACAHRGHRQTKSSASRTCTVVSISAEGSGIHNVFPKIKNREHFNKREEIFTFFTLSWLCLISFLKLSYIIS